MGRPQIPLADRLHSGIRVSEAGCWEWTKGTGAGGYGRISVRMDGYSLICYTHRVSWELHEGPIPEGLVIDHLCRNPLCCNPAHLEPVTQRINLLRGETFQAANILKTHCSYGHAFTDENTRRVARGRRCKTCERRRSNESNARKLARANA